MAVRIAKMGDQGKSRLGLAFRLVAWMNREGLTQLELSKKACILQSVCHEIMTGGRFPSCGTIQRMAQFTNLDIRYWLIGEKNGKGKNGY